MDLDTAEKESCDHQERFLYRINLSCTNYKGNVRFFFP